MPSHPPSWPFCLKYTKATSSFLHSFSINSCLYLSPHLCSYNFTTPRSPDFFLSHSISFSPSFRFLILPISIPCLPSLYFIHLYIATLSSVSSPLAHYSSHYFLIPSFLLSFFFLYSFNLSILWSSFLFPHISSIYAYVWHEERKSNPNVSVCVSVCALKIRDLIECLCKCKINSRIDLDFCFLRLKSF